MREPLVCPTRHASALVVETACARWFGTPHLPGHMTPGVGVDCARLVCAVWEECYEALAPGTPRDAGPMPRTAQDAGAHRRDLDTAPLARWFRTRFPLDSRPGVEDARAGDGLSFRSRGGVNHFGVVVGRGVRCDAMVVVHASPEGVIGASLGDPALRRSVVGVYRPLRAWPVEEES